MEQMKMLRRHEHLLRPKEREWVSKIGRTVEARGEAVYLTERQCAVIGDIFDRFRYRIGR